MWKHTNTNDGERERERVPLSQPIEPFLWKFHQAPLVVLALYEKTKTPATVKQRQESRERRRRILETESTVELEGVEGYGVAQDGSNFFELLGVAGYERHRTRKDQSRTTNPRRRRRHIVRKSQILTENSDYKGFGS